MLGLGLSLFSNTAAHSGGGAAWTPTTPANTKLVWVDLTDISTLYQDSGATTPVTADNDPVGAVKDKFTGNLFFIQGVAGTRPIYKANSGKPYLDCAGGKSLLSNTSTKTLTDGSGQHCSVAAVQFASVAGTQIFFSSDFSPRISQNLRLNGGNAETIAFDNGGTPFTDTGSALSISTAYVLRERTSTASTEIFVNGASGGSTAVSGTLQSGTGSLGIGDGTFGSKFFGCAVYGGVLGGTDASGADAYFAALM